DKMTDLAIEGMMRYVPAVRTDGWHGDPIRLPAHELLGVDTIVSNCSFVAQKVDIERVWAMNVQERRQLPDGSSRKLNYSHHIAVVFIVFVNLIGIGAYLYNFVLNEIPHGVHGVAAPGQERAPCDILLGVPGILAVPRTNIVPVIHLGIEDL